MNRFSRQVAIVAGLTLLVAAVTTARLFDVPEGLNGEYVADDGTGAAPVIARVDRVPSTDALLAGWSGQPPGAFSAAWNGDFIVFTRGPYTFATRSDDGSALFVDGKQVVDNGGQHSARQAAGTIELDRGLHTIFIEYKQEGGSLALDVLWGKQGAPLAQLPPWRLFTRRVSFSRGLVSVAIRWTLPVAVLAWLLAFAVAIVAAIRRRAPGWLAWIRADPIRKGLVAVVGISLALNVTGIWWGMPSVWAGDEMTPFAVFVAIASRFSHGWFDRYPPFHYFVLSAVSAPALLATHFNWIHLSASAQDGVLLVSQRLASIAAGAGTLIAIHLCGARVFGRRAGLLASAMFACLTLFLYYSKTANPEVPYVFWFAVSLLFLLRFLQTLATRDMLLFSTAAVFAMCTKDQAYGLYLVTPLLIVHRLWGAHREARRSFPLLRAIFDARIILAGATIAALFAAIYVLPFNLSGFLAHFKDITGPGSEPWRMFDPTIAGRASLVWLNLRLNQHAWGWPFWIASLAGVGIAARDRTLRPTAVTLLLIAASYYIGFIDLILYTFDRYLLPVCVLEALFGGLALDRLLQGAPESRRPWRTGVVAAAFAYTLVYAAAVDVLMVRDSRYAAERWLRPRIPDGEGIGIAFPLRVLPRLDGLHVAEIDSVEDLRQAAPAFFVLNADYARAVPPDSSLAEMVADLQQGRAGYRLAFQARTANPWPWLGGHPDLVGPRTETRVFSILRDINPDIEIYEREQAR